MFYNYLSIAWRNLVNNGLFSVINIAGLAIGLAACILILLFVREESGFDTWVPDSDRIVRLHTEYSFPGTANFRTVRSAGKMKDALEDYMPSFIEQGTRITPINFTVIREQEAFSENIKFVDPTFFDVLDLPFLHGDKHSAFNSPLDLVITESTAIKYFGRTDVLGETLDVCCVDDVQYSLAITGVVKDLPRNTHLKLDFIVMIKPELFAVFPGILDTFTSVNVYTYFKLHPNINKSAMQERIYYWANNESVFKDMLDQDGGTEAGMKVTDGVLHRIMPIENIYLDAKPYAGTMGDLAPLGDRTMIRTFTIVAVLLLLIACINFMNLATAKSSKRAKEVAMRKVLGATRSQVILQFLSESVGLVCIALVFALALVEVALPIYSEAIGRTIAFSVLTDWRWSMVFLAMALLIGVVAGLYPAVYLSRFLPSHILSSNKGAESDVSAKIRFALVVFQFSASICLIVCTIIVYGQTTFSNNVDAGYSQRNKLVLDVGAAGDNKDALRQQLLAHRDITSVVFSSEAPSQDNENNTYFTLQQRAGSKESTVQSQDSQKQLLNHHSMDYGFFDAYDVQPLAGRLFDRHFGADEMTFQDQGSESYLNASVILNLSAVKKYGFDSAEQAVGSVLVTDAWGGHNLKVIGVIPDIYFRSIKFNVRATAYLLNPTRFRVATITYDSKNDDFLLPKLRADIEQIWEKTVPMQPIHLAFLNEMIAAQYQSEVVQSKLFTVFSSLAIFIACLGLYGLAAFTAERRTKEIGVRKIMGAEIKDIVMLLMWQFSKPVFIANLLAWPVAIYLMSGWLQTFPYRIDMVWLLPACIIATIVSLIIAWLTIAGNTTKVARANPVNALRCE